MEKETENRRIPRKFRGKRKTENGAENRKADRKTDEIPRRFSDFCEILNEVFSKARSAYFRTPYPLQHNFNSEDVEQLYF